MIKKEKLWHNVLWQGRLKQTLEKSRRKCYVKGKNKRLTGTAKYT